MVWRQPQCRRRKKRHKGATTNDRMCFMHAQIKCKLCPELTLCVSRDDGKMVKTLIINENWLPRISAAVYILFFCDSVVVVVVVVTLLCPWFSVTLYDERISECKGFSHTKCSSEDFKQRPTKKSNAPDSSKMVRNSSRVNRKASSKKCGSNCVG